MQNSPVVLVYENHKAPSITVSSTGDKRIIEDGLRNGKPFHFAAVKRSKTQIATSLVCDNHSIEISIPLEGFPLAKSELYSYFSGGVITNWYFRKSKKNGLECYMRYVRGLVDYLHKKYPASNQQAEIKVVDFEAFLE